MNEFSQPIKKQRMTPPLNERVMLYVRQDNEDVYTPLHVVPPTAMGLLNAVSLTSESLFVFSTFYVSFFSLTIILIHFRCFFSLSNKPFYSLTLTAHQEFSFQLIWYSFAKRETQNNHT